ncbi:MAG: hypothetical protein ACYCYM_11510 [Saccharofermentanales bacterium]
MKKILSIILLYILTALMLTSCGTIQYPFKLSTEEIEYIEIVDAENALNFTVQKTLTEAEQIEFLNEFENVKFHRIIYGDPLSVSGDSIKITYKNGDYEIFCHFWAAHVIDGREHLGFIYCDETIFNDLIKKYLAAETEQ